MFEDFSALGMAREIEKKREAHERFVRERKANIDNEQTALATAEAEYADFISLITHEQIEAVSSRIAPDHTWEDLITPTDIYALEKQKEQQNGTDQN